MSLVIFCRPSPATLFVQRSSSSHCILSRWNSSENVSFRSGERSARRIRRSRRGFRTEAFFNPCGDQPILKDALKEPVAFMGGMFAGLLRLDLNEEPLRDWITRTVEASGITMETEIVEEGSGSGYQTVEDNAPLQIEIE